MTSTNRTEQDAPRLINGAPEGSFERDLASAMHSLRVIYGFDRAREIVAETWNYEAQSMRQSS